MFEIRHLTEVTDDVVEAFARLIPQLSTAKPPDRDKLEAIVRSPSIQILLAYDVDRDKPIVGTLTLVTFQTPTNKHAWIEDVVVDQAARNKGIGEALTREAMNLAAHYGSAWIDLTSRPSREDANRLYQRLGFVKRNTNLYRYTIET